MVRVARTACFTFFLLLVSVIVVTGRFLRHSSASSELVSDGIDHVQYNPSSILLLGMDSQPEECKQMYGFLPCSYSLLGHLFLMLVYEYLLFHGESYVVSGGERIFKILGPGIFGASAFHVLGALPEALILLASGLLNSKEIAQEYVMTGVGLLAGSSIFLLTLLWGTCVIFASQQLPNNLRLNSSAASCSGQNHFSRFLSPLTENGITTDLETTYTARIMVLSVIPLIIIQIPRVFTLSPPGERIFIAIALVVSAGFLLLYFFYQTFEPWIQKRRLEYVKHEHLVVDILNRVQKHTMEKLLTDDGAPNVAAITRIFEDIDQDDDKLISFSELKKLFHEIRQKKAHLYPDKTVAEVMKEFDHDNDDKITLDEFVNGFTRWLDETKTAMDKRYHSVRSLKDLYQILQPWIHKKREEHEMKKHLISEIIVHVQSSAIGSLFTADGTPDIPSIIKLFRRIDLDGDNCISEAELKELIINVRFGKIPWDADEVVGKIMEELDVSGDQAISEEEFINGLTKWLNISNNQDYKSSAELPDDVYQMIWKQTDLLVDERSIDRSVCGWTKAILILVLGIAILAVLAEPLIDTVQNFSASAEIPSFFIAFILVPLATNARGAISAIAAATRKKPRTTSLTFSEIYGGVFMSNTLSFAVLLSLIYFRGLAWNFSAEVLVVLMVSATMGLAASLSSTFPVWTSLVAYLLYPLSLVLVYVLNS